MISYSIVTANDNFIVVMDHAGVHGCMSLTNGAEQLVKELHQKGLLKEGMRLGYYDTDAQLDEIVFDKTVWESNGNCNFSAGFSPFVEQN